MWWLLSALAIGAEPPEGAAIIAGSEVGIGVDLVDDHRVSHVLVDGPAWAAGVRPGDRILGVDGQEVRRASVRETVATLLGEPDTPVALRLDREGEEVDLTVIRAELDPWNGVFATQTERVTLACWCASDSCEDGEGRAEHTLGWTYAGDFVGGRFEGTGTWKAGTEGRYVGTFQAGVPHGPGVLTDAEGTLYKGSWDHGVARGTFTIRWEDQRTYEGEVVALVPNGAGTSVYPDRSRYVGEWRHGLFHGQGTMTLADRTVYTGAFQLGLGHGQGRVTLPSGERLEGGFVKGRLQGQGKRVWPGGLEYEGWFVDSQPQGHGVQTWPDGRTHEGHFEAGLPVGWGTRTWPDGRRATGRWVDRWRVLGRLHDPLGVLVYEGWIRDGVAEGWGREVEADGTRGSERWWFNDKMYRGVGHPRSEQVGRAEREAFEGFSWDEPFGHAEPGGPGGPS
jgi:hypothetical protein